MYETTVVADNAVSAYEQVVSDRVSEDLDTESVSDYLFGFLVEVGVNKCHVVVAADAVSKS